MTAGLAVGGIAAPGVVDESETWNGTAWTEGNNINTARQGVAGTANGTTTAAIVFGGSVSPKGHTETYDGSSWTEESDLNTVSSDCSGAGTSSLALRIGGTPGTTSTEEWSLPQNVKTITD